MRCRRRNRARRTCDALGSSRSFGDVEDDAGRDRAWDRDAWRVDTAIGYRFDRHLQGKLQYGYLHQRGDVQQGEQLFAAQLTLKF